MQATSKPVHSEQVIWRTHFTHPSILNSSAVFIFIRGSTICGLQSPSLLRDYTKNGLQLPQIGRKLTGGSHRKSPEDPHRLVPVCYQSESNAFGIIFLALGVFAKSLKCVWCMGLDFFKIICVIQLCFSIIAYHTSALIFCFVRSVVDKSLLDPIAISKCRPSRPKCRRAVKRKVSFTSWSLSLQIYW